MAPSGKRYVTYIRVSTQKQGASGLGLEAQQKAVSDYLAANGGRLVDEFREVESGKKDDRPQLQAALKRCRQTRATLLIAKLDRLGRNAAFLLTLRDSNARFVCADMPDMNETMVGMLAVFAQHEREAISARTKAALAAAKARGTKKDGITPLVLGNPRLQPGNRASAAVACQAMQAKAKARAEDLREVVDAALAEGLAFTELADRLNSLDCTTPRGSTWTTPAVYRLLARLGLHQPQRRAA